MKRSILFVAVVLVGVVGKAHGVVITHGSTSINMDFVTVGDAGTTTPTNPCPQPRRSLLTPRSPLRPRSPSPSHRLP